MTNAIADAPPMHGEAVRRASGFVLVAEDLPTPPKAIDCSGRITRHS
jgi:hypothetical protein